MVVFFNLLSKENRLSNKNLNWNSLGSDDLVEIGNSNFFCIIEYVMFSL